MHLELLVRLRLGRDETMVCGVASGTFEGLLSGVSERERLVLVVEVAYIWRGDGFEGI